MLLFPGTILFQKLFLTTKTFKYYNFRSLTQNKSIETAESVLMSFHSKSVSMLAMDCT